MDNNWAAEHLQTIRTLMERSALYRRALAPISTFVGVVGIVGGMLGWKLKIVVAGLFAFYWMAIGVVAVIGALMLVRRQAVSQGEAFWSPPTRRVAQAMAPALFVGLVFGCVTVGVFWLSKNLIEPLWLVIFWTLLYGLALHSAGFFMPRGIRLFSFAFIGISLALILLLITESIDLRNETIRVLHWWMGVIFGASHLAYGIYLYFTERKNEA